MAKAKADQLRTIGRLIDEGSVVVHVEKIMPLDHVREAHDCLEHEHTQGKIVLTVT
jgi:NADPH:quinone reductase-like Zn-dependent oxidoreductase